MVTATRRQIVFVPGKEHIVVQVNGTPRTFSGKDRAKKADELLAKLEGREDYVLLGVMGGLGQEMLIRGRDEYGLRVFRIPMFRLQEATGVEVKATAEVRARAVAQAWEMEQSLFYPLGPIDANIALLRILTRTRNHTQNTLRKPVQLEFYGALRNLRYLLPSEAEDVVDLIRKVAEEKWKDLTSLQNMYQGLQGLERVLQQSPGSPIYRVTQFYANPRFVIGLLEDEAELEKMIAKLVQGLDIWKLLHPPKGAILPSVKGLGPVLGGTLIGEFGDIRRFPTSRDLRGYSRYALTPRDIAGEGEAGMRFVFPARKYRGKVDARGNLLNWSDYPAQAVWLWSTVHMLKSGASVWYDAYLYFKGREFQRHPDVVPVQIIDRMGRQKTVYQFTLGHLNRRAQRQVGSLMLEYLDWVWRWHGRGRDLDHWYTHVHPDWRPDPAWGEIPYITWEQRFARYHRELDTGLRDYVRSEIVRRKRVEPTDTEEEEEGG